MKRALVSVSDKTGVVEFCQSLVECGYQIISTGGTLSTLQGQGVEAIDITAVTNFPEILDGRVKTLSPYVHGGLLYRRDLESHVSQINEHGIEAIDLVCVNLYQFEKASESGSLADAIENIDIGGPSMIRSSAKNYKDVFVVTDCSDYDRVIEAIKSDEDSSELKANLGAKAFALTARYDAIISQYLETHVATEKMPSKTLTFDLKEELRYGENPHQSASFYTRIGGHNTIECTEMLHGKQLSYNNIQDAQAALDLLSEFTKPTVCAIKHMSPCGVGIGSNIDEAWEKAYSADPVSIFGGIVVTNCEVTASVAELMSKIFLEVIVAPSYTDEALAILTKKKNVRILRLIENEVKVETQFKSVGNGLLVQDVDTVNNYEIEYSVVTEKQPTEIEIEQMRFGQSVVKHVKSNAIVLVKDNQTVGSGGGQTSRIDSAKIAFEQAKDLGHTEDIILASDAFFPFDDVVTLAAEYGVSCIVQPGGSIRDQDSIDKCNELGISMVFTNTRHFKH
ncbi:bifunctional phosphoribosylaminoimidazolecarboxamide formyltransferase/IMP cyclohydrolase [Mollicutes bacterium LVI A0078]|nr:bifunctional phosphoribosylaminoimidazolecarboxamide formyltransferase/IMP cyclohydrolase [Mollicutes bacterium LVI A0075]WOO91521.1 bifunctional phosphoribosylaminoimidazolecarboxamide formyltransferase/IMP cyclohydrolase [Mollicutes bacterium LVI A0078]